MIIIELIYKKPLEEVDKYLEAHRVFLDKFYKSGVFVLSGPKTPRTGGVILAKLNKQEGEALIKSDPFYQYQIADYRIVEFEPNRFSNSI